jgi:hypothetical protein
MMACSVSCRVRSRNRSKNLGVVSWKFPSSKASSNNNSSFSCPLRFWSLWLESSVLAFFLFLPSYGYRKVPSTQATPPPESNGVVAACSDFALLPNRFLVFLRSRFSQLAIFPPLCALTTGFLKIQGNYREGKKNGEKLVKKQKIARYFLRWCATVSA